MGNKMKTRQAVKKRFKVSANGKIMHKRAGKAHLNTKKSRKRTRNLKGSKTVSQEDKKRIRTMLS